MNDLFDKSRARRSDPRAQGGRADTRAADTRASDARAAHDRRVIAIRGAREHNLKNVDVEIPRDQLVVFTGLSGSGKSSLAFDTIYAEGQRRYVESLSAYARQFLEMMQKPTSTRSTASRPRSRSSRRPPRAIHARPSAPSPRSTTICGSSGRASACPTRPRPGCRSRARPYRRWSTA